MLQTCAYINYSHTVATTIIFTLRILAMNPNMQVKVRNELATGFDINDLDSLADLEYLDSIVKETMRLYPVVPTGGIRMTSTSAGITVGEQYIPPETTIVAPRYSLSRRKLPIS